MVWKYKMNWGSEDVYGVHREYEESLMHVPDGVRVSIHSDGTVILTKEDGDFATFSSALEVRAFILGASLGNEWLS